MYILLFVVPTRRFLFNVGEGTQRLCMEHGIRVTKTEHLFFTHLSSDTLGGLPGEGPCTMHACLPFKEPSLQLLRIVLADSLCTAVSGFAMGGVGKVQRQYFWGDFYFLFNSPAQGEHDTHMSRLKTRETSRYGHEGMTPPDTELPAITESDQTVYR